MGNNQFAKRPFRLVGVFLYPVVNNFILNIETIIFVEIIENMKEKKVSLPLFVDKWVKQEVQKLAAQNEHSDSQTGNKLLIEALVARGKK